MRTQQPFVMPTEEEKFQRQEADMLRAKLKEESKRVLAKTKEDKNLTQKIRLIINVITPDNFEKKFEELREHMFGPIKAPSEEGYNAEVDKFERTPEMAVKLEAIVERVFSKAQNEKEYCNFYGDLCERIIKLELSFLGKKATVKNIKESEFRQQLIQFCRTSFDQFFTEQTREILKSTDMDSVLKFKIRLFGSKAYTPIKYL